MPASTSYLNELVVIIMTLATATYCGLQDAPCQLYKNQLGSKQTTVANFKYFIVSYPTKVGWLGFNSTFPNMAISHLKDNIM